MKKTIITTLVIVAFLLVLLIGSLGAAQLAVTNQTAVKPARATEELTTSNPAATVRMDETMFTMFAAMNAAGYDYEFTNMTYHPVRQVVREALAGKHFSGQQRLRAELKSLQQYPFVVWALHYGPPPEFARVQSGWSDPQIPAFLFVGLDSTLRSFYKEMEIAALWQQVRPQYEQEAGRYQQAAGDALQQVMDYTRTSDLPMKKVVIIPNLLSANWSGFGPKVGDTAYTVVGPTEGKPDVSLMQHEALHSIIGPLVEANLSVVSAEQSAALNADLQKRVPSGYSSWEGVVEEQVVRAVRCRIAWETCQEFGILKNDERQGFLLERTMLASLEQFEQGSTTLAEFMPRLLESLNQLKVPLQSQ